MRLKMVANKDKLSTTAYRGIEGKDYIPHIYGDSKKHTPEGSIVALIIGILLTILFASSTTYLGLTAGMTVAAGIPGSILGMSLLYIFAKQKSILDGNVIQTMSSGGESVASGIIFVLPAFMIMGLQFSFFQAILAGLVGSMISLAVVSLIRKYLIVQSHTKLVYPESMAISEILVASDAKDTSGIKTMSLGAFIGAFFTAIGSGVFSFINTKPIYFFSKFKGMFALSLTPAVIGVGYIVGAEVGVAIAAGAILANYAFIPIFGLFGDLQNTLVLFPSTIPLAEMTADNIAGSYIRYIGAGAIATGGFITVLKMVPIVVLSVKKTFTELSIETNGNYDPDISLKFAAGLMIVSILIIILLSHSFVVGVVASLLVLICTLLFSVVAARLTGLLGTSNLPVSGMTIASLLIVTPTFVLLNFSGDKYLSLLILLATSIVTTIALSGGLAQSLKTTFIVGGTTKKIQYVYLISSIVGIMVVVSVILLLEKAYGFKNSDILVAPQANLISFIIQGITSGNLPWVFIIMGSSIAVTLAMLKLPVMSVAIGFYLPMPTAFAVLLGGIVRYYVDKKYANDHQLLAHHSSKGVIFSSGLIAGEAIFGLLIALITVLINDQAFFSNIGNSITGNIGFLHNIWFGFIFIGFFLYLVYKIITNPSKSKLS